MLLFSYIIAAALELVMTLISYQAGNISFTWSFGFLLFLSAASIPLETSNLGKLVRTEFKSIGVNTVKYDLVSNSGRILVYAFILGDYLSLLTGLFLAYAVTFIMLIIAIYKYARATKNEE